MSRIRVVLQARTTSTRLPGKVLLPLGGLPLAVLCAKRLSNTGRDVILATSDDATDDALARYAARAEISVFRGSLDNVLHRFAGSVEDLAEKDIVVRATGDNPLPDGAFVDALVTKYLQHNVAYLGTSSPYDGLPYGLSGEVFTVGALRERAHAVQTDIEREHVTSFLKQRNGEVVLLRPGDLISGNYAHLRCTIDTLDDFVNMANLFDSCLDPIATSWRSLLHKLSAVKVHST